jgi:hypothetical protein
VRDRDACLVVVASAVSRDPAAAFVARHPQRFSSDGYSCHPCAVLKREDSVKTDEAHAALSNESSCGWREIQEDEARAEEADGERDEEWPSSAERRRTWRKGRSKS